MHWSKATEDIRKYSNSMKKDIELYELIENYLNDNLTAEERSAFETRISNDLDLASTVENHRQLSALIEEGTLLEIRDTIQKIHNENPGGGSSGITGKRIVLYSAIAFITILTSLILIQTNNRKPKSSSPLKTQIVSDSIEISDNSGLADQQVTSAIESIINKEQIEEQKENKIPIESIERSPNEKILYETEEEKATVSEAETDKTAIPQEQNAPATEVSQQISKADKPAASHLMDSVNCDTVVISAEVLTEESCEERATGKLLVIIESNKGATPPYYVSIDNGRNFQQNSQIVDLYPGNYSVWLKDKNNCLSKIGNFLVGSIVCDYEYIFAPDKGERWKVPTGDESGVLRIYTKQGGLIYTQNFEIGQELLWDGSSLNGNPQPMGVYRFIIEFNTGEPVIGNVTIVR